MAHNKPQFTSSPAYEYNGVVDDEERYHHLPLGRPTKKRRFEYVHILATAVSWICLVVAYITIVPHLPLAWRLGFNGQIILIGLLLSIMNVCSSTVLPYTFLLLEARFGPSSLQNYEALLTSRTTLPQTRFVWRLALGLSILLPLGLSVAYKRFLGGKSSADITAQHTGQYGIDFPDIGSWSPSGDGIYLLASSMAPFLSASQSKPQPYPAEHEFPSPFGYNTLLLNNYSAALLDIPTKPYVSRAQASISQVVGEEWYMSSTVNAYVAEQVFDSDFRSNDSTWLNDIDSSVHLWPASGMSGAYLWERGGVSVGFMPAQNNTRCFIGIYSRSRVQEGFLTFSSPRDPEFAAFRRSAVEFSLSRRRCLGEWKLNSTSMVLLGGDCDLETPVNSSVLQAPFTVTYPWDLLPELNYVFTRFAPAGNSGKKRVDDTWLNATYAVSVVTAWWSRALYIQQVDGADDDLADYGGLYPAVNESIISTRPTLKAMPLLYVVLTVHPTITLIALLVAAGLYHVPVGRGFGVVSILSGLDQSSSHIIRGAGFSGRLEKEVRMQITPEALKPDDESKVSYRLIDTERRTILKTVK